MSSRRPRVEDAGMVDTYSVNKSVRSDNTYGRYTDWDSSSASRVTLADTREEYSHNSQEQRETYIDEVRDMNTQVRLASSREKKYSQTTARPTRRGRMGPNELLMSPTSVNAVKSFATNLEDEASVRTSITNSRSVTSPERRLRNSRYEPALKNQDDRDSIVDRRAEMPLVVRTRNNESPHKKPTHRPKANDSREYLHGTSVKSSQFGQPSFHGAENGQYSSIDSISDESRLLGSFQCYSTSVGTYTLAPSKRPPLKPRAAEHVEDPTPRASNITSVANTINRSRSRLKSSNTDVSSVTSVTGWCTKQCDEDTQTIENSIPSALEFSNKTPTSMSNKRNNRNNLEDNEMKYWMDLSVRAAIAVIQVNGSETVAEKAANTVLEAGRKMKLREKERDMHQVLRFLATKTSVAVLEAGGNQRVATAVAHAIMSGETADDADSDVDRSLMLSHIDKSISSNMKKCKNINRESKDTNDRIRNEDDPPTDNAEVRLPASSTLRSACSKGVNSDTAGESISRKLSRRKSSQIPDVVIDIDTGAPQMANKNIHTSHNSDMTISRSNLSFERCSQQAENSTPSLEAREKLIEDAARLQAQKEQEIMAKMAALDAATNALLAKANNVQQFIDQQVAKKQADASYYRATGEKGFQTVCTGDDPGFHHNFSGKSVQIDDKFRNNHHKPSDFETRQQRSVFEKFTNQLSQMIEFAACTTPTTVTQTSSANVTTPFSSHAQGNGLPNLNCHGGVMESDFSEPYAYSDRNDDMISALTEDIPGDKKWPPHSRLNLAAENRRLNEYGTRPWHPVSTPKHLNQTEPNENNHRMKNSTHVVQSPNYKTKTDLNEANTTKGTLRVIPSNNENNIASHPNETMNHALDNAMHQLSSQLLQEPYDQSHEVAIINTAENQNKVSGIGKLKGAFLRKKTTKTVTFGIGPEQHQTNGNGPKSPKEKSRVLGGFGRKKNEKAQC
eukprot:CCRYP_017236-RA/>CCRYP_017236-RA protein AED:0.34 eAED:0.34 QI:0/-1/0/1/-1/1/1/0/958